MWVNIVNAPCTMCGKTSGHGTFHIKIGNHLLCEKCAIRNAERFNLSTISLIDDLLRTRKNEYPHKCENCGCEFNGCEIKDGLCAECLNDKIETESESYLADDF